MNHVDNTFRIFFVHALGLKSAILQQIAWKSTSQTCQIYTYIRWSMKRSNNLSGSTGSDVIEAIFSHYRVSEIDREKPCAY